MSTQRNTFLPGAAIDLVLLEADDNTTMLPWINNPKVNKFLSRGATPMTLPLEDAFIANAYTKPNNIVFGIWHKCDQKLIGNTGLHGIDQLNQTATFGIVIGNEDYWGNGYGAEVLNLMLAYAFTRRNLRNITLSVLGNNPRGKQCYENCGFIETGVYQKHVYKEGEWHDEIFMIAKNPLYR
jgi:RimJ/RimL family protein N-acetyltransferase